MPVKSYTKLGSTAVRNFKDIKGSAMDDQGHMFALAKTNGVNCSSIIYHQIATEVDK